LTFKNCDIKWGSFLKKEQDNPNLHHQRYHCVCVCVNDVVLIVFFAIWTKKGRIMFTLPKSLFVETNHVRQFLEWFHLSNYKFTDSIASIYLVGVSIILYQILINRKSGVTVSWHFFNDVVYSCFFVVVVVTWCLIMFLFLLILKYLVKT